MADKKFMGPSFNKIVLLGTVEGEINVIAQGQGEYVFLNLKTQVPELGPDKSWQELDIIVPVLVTDSRKVEPIKKFVKPNRQLLIEGYYKSWESGGQQGHAIMATTVKFGNTNAHANQEGGNNLPPMP